MAFSFSNWLTRVGGCLTPSQVHAVSATAKYLEIGQQLRKFEIKVGPTFTTREELFDLAGREVSNKDVLYLEFGVYQGATTRYWSKLLGNPSSKLHGFDSFEGLPEVWTDAAGKGHFSTKGAIPTVDDPRVKFFKGWFDQTLPAYEVADHEVLVLNFDADLYSSTKCALDRMSNYIVPGTYLYFDEFSDLQHEFRAFVEFCSSSSRRFVMRGATTSMFCVLFQCVA
jgi:Macrocin-O-methyltransferase (TylF)